MRTRRYARLLVGCLVVAGCADPVRPDSIAAPITVMTRNLYVGVDLGRIAGPFDLVPLQVADAFTRLQSSNFAERAQVIADEVAAAQPHLIGLQEVSLIRIQTPGDAVLGGRAPATNVVADYLQILLNALAARGLSYKTAAVAEGFDVEAPMVTSSAPTFSDVRLTDREVILARDDVALENIQQRTFSATNLLLGTFPLTRAWASVDATIAQKRFRFVSTHLEPLSADGTGSFQTKQARELIDAHANSPLPVVLVGDFNSAADESTTATYAMIRSASYDDAWILARHQTSGFTCCHAEDLRNPVSQLDTRIDFIFVTPGVSIAEARLAGHEPSGKTPFGLWPSDHAGVIGMLRLP